MTGPRDYDPFETERYSHPAPADDGPDPDIIDMARAYEEEHAHGGWDQAPQLLWVRNMPDGLPPTLEPAPAPQGLLRSGLPHDAVSALAQTLAQLGDTAARIIPEDTAAVALIHEAWAVPAPRPGEVTPEEMEHLKQLRRQRQLHTRPDRIEQRYLHVIDLAGNEANIRRERGTDGAPDRVDVQAWGAARIATFYRGDVIDAMRELAAVVRRAVGAPVPPPDFRTVFGLN